MARAPLVYFSQRLLNYPLIMIVPDEGDSRNVTSALNSISTCMLLL